MSNRIKVRVPGTTANCGPGFDTVGIACTIYNTLELILSEEPGLSIVVHGEGSSSIQTDENNIVVLAVKKVLARIGASYPGISIIMENNIPTSRGLGSSAAAVIAGLVAANAATGKQLTCDEILNLATEMEGHPDNVAPALFGGITVSYQDKQHAGCLRVMPPEGLQLVAVIPEFTLSTRLARQVLPKTVPMKDAVYNVSRAALLVGALCSGDTSLLRPALQDKLHQPYRAKLIPGMNDCFQAALNQGALGAVISGAGSTLMAFVERDAEEVGEAMVQVLAKYNVASRYVVLGIDTEGVMLIS